MANIHDDLLKEIMLWLPVESLLRFRCLCKSLCAMIDTKSFIYSHLKRCSEYGIHCKLFYRESKPINRETYAAKVHSFGINDGFIEKFSFTEPLPSITRCLLVSHCNGLLFLRLSSHKFSVWNPSTKQYRKLPAFPVIYPHHSFPIIFTFGLGYDSVPDDYKVIVLLSGIDSGTQQVWISGLKSPCWRWLGSFPFSENHRVDICGNGDCFVDCALHFVCYRKDLKSHILVAFDVAKETFSEVLEPVYQKQLPKGYEICLHAVSGCLCISFFDHNLGQIDLYRRKKEGMEFIWTKLYSVTVQQMSEDGFRYIRSGKILVYSEERGKVLILYYGRLFWFDIREKSLEEIKFKNSSDVLDHVFCIESLVPVGY